MKKYKAGEHPSLTKGYNVSFTKLESSAILQQSTNDNIWENAENYLKHTYCANMVKIT